MAGSLFSYQAYWFLPILMWLVYSYTACDVDLQKVSGCARLVSREKLLKLSSLIVRSVLQTRGYRFHEWGHVIFLKKPGGFILARPEKRQDVFETEIRSIYLLERDRQKWSQKEWDHRCCTRITFLTPWVCNSPREPKSTVQKYEEEKMINWELREK